VVDEALRARIQSEPWARALGVEYLALEPGRCVVALALRPEMLNYQGRPHGGVLFSLADIAFGAACNAAGQTAVAVSMTISFLAPAPARARLVAEGAARRQGRQTGFYEVEVRTEAGALVAIVQCVAHRPEPRGLRP
jgi:acyl-CoA thioesterase